MDIARKQQAQQQAMQAAMERRQLQDFIVMYNNLTKHCFDSCINDFKGPSVQAKESACIANCVGKYLKSSNRISMRFAESQMAMQGGVPPAQ
eukprot:m.26541 g.26541  ORF g.26541 m.26541 type:complete len:92 (+) comp38663_c0_seq1:106-381(+)